MRPIIKIYNLGDSKYEVDIDVFHITREDAYNIMSTLCEIYYGENLLSNTEPKGSKTNKGYEVNQK